MHNISVKAIGLDQLLLLQEISKQTFIETFSATNSEENMALYLSEALSVERLKQEMEQSNAHFFFAYDDTKPIGYLKVNTGDAQTELSDPDALEIERIYVIKDYHGKKIGQILLDKALRMAQLHRVKYIWLGVWEKNHKAILFYRKNDFVEFDKHVFHLGHDAQTDIMMKRAVM